VNFCHFLKMTKSLILISLNFLKKNKKLFVISPTVLQFQVIQQIFLTVEK